MGRNRLCLQDASPLLEVNFLIIMRTIVLTFKLASVHVL
jgi:hypothetical protein